MKVAVIFGGKSEEHEVSRLSAVNMIRGLAETSHQIIKIGITKKGAWFLTDANNEEIANGAWESNPSNKKVAILCDPIMHGILVFDKSEKTEVIRIDCALLALHGTYGEDGNVQGLLSTAEIPYVGSRVKASANAMDKSIAKTIIKGTGISMAKDLVIRKNEFDENYDGCISMAKAFADGIYPVFVKPASQGSSVGASKVHDLKELEPAIIEAFRHDDKILIEEGIVGREFEVAVLGNLSPKASGVGEIISGREFYDYEAKYNDSTSRTSFVTDLPNEKIDEIRECAIKIYKTLECAGLARVDFFYKEDGKIIFNEVNTLPGFTDISMYPKLWEKEGISISVLLDSLIKLGMGE